LSNASCHRSADELTNLDRKCKATKLHAAAEDYIYKQKREEENYTTYDIFEAFSN